VTRLALVELWEPLSFGATLDAPDGDVGVGAGEGRPSTAALQREGELPDALGEPAATARRTTAGR